MALATYQAVLIFLTIAVGFPIAIFVVADFMRPYRRADDDWQVFEAASVPIGEARIQFHFQYFTFAILFLVFDVVVSLLLLFAWFYSRVSAFEDRMFILAVMSLFALGTLPIIVYILKKEEEIWI